MSNLPNASDCITIKFCAKWHSHQLMTASNHFSYNSRHHKKTKRWAPISDMYNTPLLEKSMNTPPMQCIPLYPLWFTLCVHDSAVLRKLERWLVTNVPTSASFSHWIKLVFNFTFVIGLLTLNKGPVFGSPITGCGPLKCGWQWWLRYLGPWNQCEKSKLNIRSMMSVRATVAVASIWEVHQLMKNIYFPISLLLSLSLPPHICFSN